MKSYSTDRVRNVLVVGHGGAGKTTLVESLLNATGVTNRVLGVEDGTTVTDFEPEETRKLFGLPSRWPPSSTTATRSTCSTRPATPTSSARCAPRSPPSTPSCSWSAPSKVSRPRPRSCGRWPRRTGLPRAFFVNKLDRDRASFQRALTRIQETFGKSAPPCTCPSARSRASAGWSRLLSGQAFTYKDGTRVEGDVPEDLSSEAEDLRAQLIESIIQEAEDEELMEHYLEGETITPSELIPDLEKAVATGASSRYWPGRRPRRSARPSCWRS